MFEFSVLTDSKHEYVTYVNRGYILDKVCLENDKVISTPDGVLEVMYGGIVCE